MWNVLLKRLYFVKEMRNACSELHEEGAWVQNKNKDTKEQNWCVKWIWQKIPYKILGMENAGRSSEEQEYWKIL